jgi:hypothetical protein
MNNCLHTKDNKKDIMSIARYTDVELSVIQAAALAS